jgi:hypothetical protein
VASVTHGISSQYPFLATARRDVDWRHVSPILLRQLNALGRAVGKVIVIFSGYRSDSYSAAHGGFAGDPHTHHIAVDATIGGRPIGAVVSAKMFKEFGLRSGNQPNFYKGKADPSHVDLVGTVNAGASQSAAPNPSAATGTGPAEGAAALPDFSGTVPTQQIGAGPPGVLDPGTVPAGGFSPHTYQQMWQLVATQSGASQDTLDYAKLFSS